MAQASKRLRRERRVRRQLSLYHQRDHAVQRAQAAQQQLEAFNLESYQTRVALYAVLAQHGGSMTITEGTLKQVIENIRNLSVENTGLKDGEFTITLVDRPEPLATTTVNPATDLSARTTDHTPDQSEPAPQEAPIDQVDA